MKKQFFIFLLTTLLAVSALSGCTADSSSTAEAPSEKSQPVGTSVVSLSDGKAAASSQTVSASPAGTYTSDDSDSSWDTSSAASITFNQSAIQVDGAGASVSGSTVTITNAGTYVLSGTLADSQVIVDADKNDLVRLVLNGVTLSCSTSAPIYSKQADKTILILADGTQNVIQDAAQYVYASGEDEPDAAIFSKDSLSITGSGNLTVTGNYNNGIGTKDDLVITSGVISVSAPNDTLRGKDSVSISGGTFQLVAGGGGIQSNNDTDSDKGWICLDGGAFQINAGNDAVQAETSLTVTGGDYTIQTAGGSANAEQASNDSFGGFQHGQAASSADTTASTDETVSDSYKAFKASTSIEVSGGTFLIDSEDDSIHSNGDITIQGGDFTISTGDDGFHADSALTINGGTIRINTCYEGLEGGTIDINGGDIRLTSSDDGINAAGGSDTGAFAGGAQTSASPKSGTDTGTVPTAPADAGSSDPSALQNKKGMGRPNEDTFTAKGDYYIRITGGFVWVDASGDGLDSNNSLYIDGGTVIVNGPTNSGNGALDYDGTCEITGGTLIASGNSGMAQAPGTSSTQNSLMVYFDSTQPAGTLVNLTDSSGSSILTFAPSKDYQSIVISSPELKQGETYTLSSGGSAGSENNGGLYSGSYSSGTKLTDVTLSSTLTKISQDGSEVSGNAGMGGGRGGMGNGQGKGTRGGHLDPASGTSNTSQAASEK